jgi:hypothetical protein
MRMSASRPARAASMAVDYLAALARRARSKRLDRDGQRRASGQGVAQLYRGFHAPDDKAVKGRRAVNQADQRVATSAHPPDCAIQCQKTPLSGSAKSARGEPIFVAERVCRRISELLGDAGIKGPPRSEGR